MHLLTVLGIYKKGEQDFVLQEINFTQQAFQKIAIAGETGSGKSTLLKIIAGLIQPDAGKVLFEKKRVRGPQEELVPGHPHIAYLSQHFELRTNYRVEEVLEYANKLTVAEAHTLYAICRIDHLLKRRTDQLSGGEKQRIALARLLTTSPRLLLLDEPFSNLDRSHKNILKSVIDDLGEKLGISCILVSHDPLDILSWADEIIILKDGGMLQRGTPIEIYRQPVNEYTAALFGNYNLIDASDLRSAGGFDGLEIKNERLLIRPEQFFITKEKTSGIMGRVSHVSFMGAFYELTIILTANKHIMARTLLSNFVEGETVYLTLSAENIWHI